MKLFQSSRTGTTDKHAPAQIVDSRHHLQSQGGQRYHLISLLAAIGISELCYLLLIALSPLPALHLNDTPFTAAWPWILVPSHMLLDIIGSTPPAWLAPLLLALTLLGLICTYGYPCIRNRPVSGTFTHEGRTGTQEKQKIHWLLLLLAGVVLFSLTLLFQPKLFSDNIFTYIFSGRLLMVYHIDPLNTAPAQFSADPYLRWIISGRDAPNIYGPLWYCIAALLVSIGGGPVSTLLLFKGTAILSHLVNTLLIWSILRRIAPTRQLIGTLLYAWNPLILIELAGSGHNEGLLVMLLLLATWIYIAKSAQPLRLSALYYLGALLLFGLALSVNLIVLLLAPLLIWFEVRTQPRTSRALANFTVHMLILCLPAVLLWLPFWRGATSFFALTSAIDMQHFVHSPVGTLEGPFRALFRFVAYTLHFPAFLDPLPAADVALRTSASFIFALIYFDQLGRVRHAPTTLAGKRHRVDTDQAMLVSGFDILLAAWNISVVAYLGLVSGWFWPWYLLWMLWIVALRRFDAFASMVLILAGTALFLYPLQGFPESAITVYIPTLIFGIPLVYLVVVMSRRRRIERISRSHE